jgi:hypothetical protein
VVLESKTPDEKTDWVDDGREPESVKTVFWLPDTTVAGSKPERKTIRDELTVEESENDADPVTKRDYK